MSVSVKPTSPAQWKQLLEPYQVADSTRSIWQLVTTIVPFLALWSVMYWSLSVGYWLTLLLSVPAAMLVVRMFMFQHDCGHQSFFPSLRANNLVGGAIGVLTLVPYAYWRKTHAIHHAGSGNLDHRSFGDIDTLTVREYLSLPRFQRFLYRAYRHPFVLLVIGPVWQFVIKHRFPADLPRDWKREWSSVHGTNLALLAILVAAHFTVGLKAFLLIQAPIVAISGSIGVFLFYIQHQYDEAYWRYKEEWNYYDAGLHGSSHLVLPRWLQWLTANIGIHHVHHISSRIPNYRLEECMENTPVLQQATKMTLWDGVKTLRLTLWDEDARTLIGFRELPAVRKRLSLPAEGVQPVKPGAIPKSWR